MRLEVVNTTKLPVSKSVIARAIKQNLPTGFNQAMLELSVHIVGEKRIKSLNTRFRQLETATTVLSFPQKNPRKTKELILGDIFLCPVQIKKKYPYLALDQALSDLTIHGLGHLLGKHQP